MFRAPTDLNASRLASSLRLIENATVGPDPTRVALPSASESRSTGCSNMWPALAKVPSLACRKIDRLSRAHTYSFTHASSSTNARGVPPAAATMVRLRDAMMSLRPLVEMNAIDRPSGE